MMIPSAMTPHESHTNSKRPSGPFRRARVELICNQANALCDVRIDSRSDEGLSLRRNNLLRAESPDRWTGNQEIEISDLGDILPPPAGYLNRLSGQYFDDARGNLALTFGKMHAVYTPILSVHWRPVPSRG